MSQGKKEVSQGRYCHAADSTRPYGSHRYEVWSPKIARRLTLFGARSLQCWIRIEADSEIKRFCERPVIIPSVNGVGFRTLFQRMSVLGAVSLFLLHLARTFPGKSGAYPRPVFNIIQIMQLTNWVTGSEIGVLSRCRHRSADTAPTAASASPQTAT